MVRSVKDDPRDEPIAIRGARVHNLKGLDCDIPRNRLVVVTGPSGSGKSSLAFDTLYAEGQRRYVESLSPWARQFLEQMERPEVESVHGLSPAIAIEQRTTVAHPRSTVGTVTEIYDHLRVLFATLGRPHCPRCGEPVLAQGADEMAARLLEQSSGAVAVVAAPVGRGRKGAYRKELEAARAAGLQRARIDGRAVNLAERPALDPRRGHRVDVLVDRLALRESAADRLRASLEKALSLAGGVVLVSVEGLGERLLSRHLACARCDVSVPELSPRSFSFNSVLGACPACDGLGQRWEVDAARIMPDPSRSVLDGGIRPWHRHGPRLLREALFEVAERHGFSLETPVGELRPAAREVLLFGDEQGFPGVVPYLRRRVESLLRLDPSPGDDEGHEGGEAFDDLRPYLTEGACRACKGTRLRPESLAVRVAGHSVADLVRLPLSRARQAVAELSFGERERAVGERLAAEILSRLDVLVSLGLGYLTLDRATTTLSGGEAHRLRLATQIGARMQGLLYVLDEPSVGLHQRDNARLIETLVSIRDAGNTVVVVEHDEETIRAADWVLDLGEGAGARGGRLMYAGPPAAIDGSLTGRYLRGELAVPVPSARRPPRGWLRVLGARAHNLRDLDVSVPLGALTAVTGVSGSGKSTLVEDVLHRSLARRLYRAAPEPGRHRALEGAEAIDKVIAIDQSPIGRTPRSNPATYTGAFALVRDIFSLVPEARARGYRPGRFSFNVKGGRCEACQGDGVRRVEMHFLPDVFVRCEACQGRRYNRETLEVLYRGHSIADVLDLSVDAARELLAAHPRLARLLGTLSEVGLGYLRLGQSAATLSGGEAQRVRLARELGRRETGRTLYLLDEPTTGLHFDDVRRLLDVLARLVDAGNTVVVIEHNLDVIKSADWVVDIGPEAGERGGRLVAEGTPEQVARSRKSHTARYLRPLLARPTQA
ncbi:MAG TPA: excinuclease ABC subunit UvrA [Vicinamibacteria bacterium]|nr:excinuclease ABC subunit UvrA [Vicinamibacteria bacterium]